MKVEVTVLGSPSLIVLVSELVILSVEVFCEVRQNALSNTVTTVGCRA